MSVNGIIYLGEVLFSVRGLTGRTKYLNRQPNPKTDDKSMKSYDELDESLDSDDEGMTSDDESRKSMTNQ